MQPRSSGDGAGEALQWEGRLVLTCQKDWLVAQFLAQKGGPPKDR